jgi:tetratricopeptide (TPR) repeat protein
MLDLGDVLAGTGRRYEAVPLSETALRRTKARFGNDDPMTLRAMNNLAFAYNNVGRAKDALELHEKTYGLRKAKLGPDHFDTLHSLSGIAGAYGNLARFAEVVTKREEVFRLSKSRLGLNHPYTLGAQYWLVWAYLQVDRVDDAISHCEQNLKLRKAVLGDAHPETLRSMHQLGIVLAQRGRLDEALSLVETAWKINKAKSGADHHDTLQQLSQLADLYLRAKQPEKAIPLYNEYLMGIGTILRSDQPRLARMQANVGFSYLTSGQFAEAEKVLRTCLTIREKTEPDYWTTYDTQSQLGGALLGQKNYADAEKMLLAGYEGMKQREDQIPARSKIRLTRSLERLVQLYDAWGQKDKADEWRKKLEQAKAEVKPPGQP